METCRIFASRVAALFRSRRLDNDLADEISNHLELATEENMLLGMSRSQARTAALEHFGGPTQIQEMYRQQRGFPLLNQVTQDLRFALRQLYRSPGFALTAIATLALGLGATTAIFSLVNALLLRPLAVPQAERLTVLSMVSTDEPLPSYNFNAPLFRTLERRSDVFEAVAGVTDNVVPVRDAAGTQELPVTLVSGQYFEMMKVAPLVGRYLLPADDVAGARVVVISEGFWHARLHGAKDVIGQKLVIANVPFTIVGVMPHGFVGTNPTRRQEMMLPLSAEPDVDSPYDWIGAGFHANFLLVFGRRKDGITLEQTNAALRAATIPIVDEAGADEGYIKDAETNHMRFATESGERGFSYLRHDFEKPLVMLLCLCGAVLLLACLNLTSLLTARAAARERELATRLAIGATRGRLIQQLLVETFLIVCLGSGTGVLVSPMVSHSLAAILLSSDRNASLDTGLDARVFLFAALIAMITTLLVGLLPALRATSRDAGEQMKRGAYARTAHDSNKLLPRVLLGSEVALALMLLIGAGLLATSLARLYKTGIGFDPKGLVTLQLNMDKQALKGAALVRWYEEFAQALEHQPGVKAVSYEAATPMSGSTMTDELRSAVSNGGHQIFGNEVAPGYFATMGIPVLAGREFNWRDTPGSGDKVILNESAAKLLFPGRSAVGEVVVVRGDSRLEVVAVVGDAKYVSIRAATPPTEYLPIPQKTQGIRSYAAVVRYAGDVQELARVSREIAGKMAPEIPAPILTTMSRQIDVSLTTERMMAMLSLFFAGSALLVTGIGLYGTLAYTTARRTNEIGIRMALGARRQQVMALILHENLWSTAIGAAGGLFAALAGARLLASFLYNTSIHDPWVLASSIAAMGLIACAASTLPAWRASTIEPMEALRAE
jgi:predicted permease